MANIVAVTVDEKGDLHVDFSGYTGGACQVEEAELRKILAELGLKAEVKGMDRKAETTPRHATFQQDRTQKVKPQR